MAADDRHEAPAEDPPPTPDAEPPWPIGFMVLVGLAALYLGWRLIQLIVQAVGWIA